MKRAIRWEYLTVYVDHMHDERLNELGNQGWELAHVYPFDEYHQQKWLFKRERKT
jgi:hypothetical protein